MKRRFLPDGLHRSTEYNIWCHMKRRCYNKSNPAYSLYGGRGITMCDEWRNDFMAFYRDMAPRPSGCSIDRIDNARGYSKENCRWATPKEQANNVRHNTIVEYGGEKMTLTQFGELMGLTKARVWYLYNVRNLSIGTIAQTYRKSAAGIAVEGGS